LSDTVSALREFVLKHQILPYGPDTSPHSTTLESCDWPDMTFSPSSYILTSIISAERPGRPPGSFWWYTHSM